MWFDGLWPILQLCWAAQPESRPGIIAILGCLEQVSRDWGSLPPATEDIEMGESNLDKTLVTSGMFPYSISSPVILKVKITGSLVPSFPDFNTSQSTTLNDQVLQHLWENIAALAPPQDLVGNILYFPTC